MNNLLNDIQIALSKNVFLKQLPEETLSTLLERWQEPHRHYHNLNHLQNLLKLIEIDRNIDSDDIDWLQLIALMHDIVYDPTRTDNEEFSAKLTRKIFGNCVITHPFQNIGDILCEVIMETKNHSKAETKLGRIFCYYDVKDLLDADPFTLIKNENLLFKEFQFLPVEQYIMNRTQFLDQFCIDWKNKGLTEDASLRLQQHVNYIKNFRPRIGIYLMESLHGKWSDLHNGHLDIIDQASKLFDKVVVLYRFSGMSDLKQMQARLSYCEVTEHAYKNFLEIYQRVGDVTLIQGVLDTVNVRHVRSIQRLMPEVHNICLVCREEHAFITPEFIKTAMQFGC